MENTLPQLTDKEIRVLGCLIEKSRTTPDYYPLTLNSLVGACNQKTSRDPVVNYSKEEVISALDGLRKKKLAGTVVGGGSRVTKYKHNMQLTFSLGNDDLAALCLLLLRGPLTVGEINSNSGRLFEFDSLDEVLEVLTHLSEQEPAFIKQIARKAGQKERRYVHLFTTYDSSAEEEETSLAKENETSLSARVEQLEIELKKLREEFDGLYKELH